MKPAVSLFVAALVIGCAFPGDARPGHGGAASIQSGPPTLVAGSGWTGLIAQPAQVGDPSAYGYDDPAIAIFDDIPYQTFATAHTFGVYARHNASASQISAGKKWAMDRVECSLDNGPWASVSEPSTNPVDGREEYLFTFDPTQYSDGLKEIRCIAYPVDGIPVVLQGNNKPRSVATLSTLMVASASSGTMTVTGGATPAVGDSVDCFDCKAGLWVTADLGGGDYTLSDSVTFGSQNMMYRARHSLFLNANAGGSLYAKTVYVNSVTGNDTSGDGTAGNPFATIYKAIDKQNPTHSTDVGGLTVLLQCPSSPTSYSYGTSPANFGEPAATQWVTVKPAAGCARSDVVFDTDGGGLRTEKIRLQGVTVSGIILKTVSSVSGQPPLLWLDDVVDIGAGYLADSATPYATTSFAGLWATGGEYSQFIDVFSYLIVGRNIYVHDISQDAWSRSAALFNNVLENVIPQTGGHPDVYQITLSNPTNAAVDGLTANVVNGAQGIFTDGQINNMVMANLTLDNSDQQTFFHYIFYFVGGGTNQVQNLLMYDSSFGGPKSNTVTSVQAQFNNVQCPVGGGITPTSGQQWNGGTCQ